MVLKELTKRQFAYRIGAKSWRRNKDQKKTETPKTGQKHGKTSNGFNLEKEFWTINDIIVYEM